MSKDVSKTWGCVDCNSVDFINGRLVCTDTNDLIENCECPTKFDKKSIQYNIELKIKIIKHFFNHGLNTRTTIPEKPNMYMAQMDRIHENVWYFNSNFIDAEGFIIENKGKLLCFDLSNSFEDSSRMNNKILVDFIPYYISWEDHDKLVDNSWFMEHKFDQMSSQEIFDKLFEGIDLPFEKY